MWSMWSSLSYAAARMQDVVNHFRKQFGSFFKS